MLGGEGGGGAMGGAGGGEGGEGDAEGGRDGGGDTGGWQPTMSGEYRCALKALVVQPAFGVPDSVWRPGSVQLRTVGALPGPGLPEPSGFSPGTCHTRRTSE